MKTSYMTMAVLLFSTAVQAYHSPTTSALQYQQQTSTRIVVEENHLRFFTANHERMTIDALGHVGIGGGTSPALLHLLISGSKKALRIYNSSNHAQFNLWTTEVGGNKQLRIDEDTEGKNVATFLQNGRVGIGTASPEAKLEIHELSGLPFKMKTSHASMMFHQHALTLESNPSYNHIPYIQWKTPNGKRQAYLGWQMNYFNLTLENGYHFSINGGHVGIGTPSPSHKLHVEGDVRAHRFISNTNTYADFVFEDQYRLALLSEVEEFIKANYHLPGIPSETEAKANGIDLQEMQAKLLQKIEELTLYVIELKRENENQQKRIEKLETKNQE